MYALKETATSIPYDSVAQSLEVALAISDSTDRSDPVQNAALAWEVLKRAADINFYKPKTQPDILVEASSAGGEEHYILKEPKRGLYLQISPEDYYVYSLMEGNRTVVDLVVSYCMKYKVIAQTRVINFVQSLRGYGLLAEEFYDVYDTISLKLGRRTIKYWTDQLLRIFITRRQIAISGIDRAIGALYRWLGWIFFTRPVRLLMLVVTFLGVAGFATLAVSGQYSVLGNQESVAAGLATLGVLQIASIFLHECAHALTLKHFKREVRRAGLLFYLGLLGAFVDTTDIWYEGKWKRLAVTAAGPFMNLFLGGASVFLILARPNDALNGIIYQFALAQYLMVAFNAAPFIKLDGYYLLTDLFGISSLRERALDFLRNELPKLAASAWSEGRWLPKLSRDEKLMTLYGTVAVLWTVNLFLLGVLLAPVQFVNIIRRIFSGAELGQLILPLGFVLSLLLGFLPQIFVLCRKGLQSLSRMARNQSAWQVCLVLVGVALVTTAVPIYVSGESPFVAALYARLLTTAATLAATFIAYRQVQFYKGSQWRPMFIGLALSAGLVAIFNLVEYLFPQNGSVKLQTLGLWHLIGLIPAVIGIGVRLRLWAMSLSAELRWVWALTSSGTLCIVLAALTPPPTLTPHMGAQLGQYLWCAGLFLHWHLTRRGLPYKLPAVIPPEVLAGDPQSQAQFALKWIGERAAHNAFQAVGRQNLLPLAASFNRDNAVNMRRVWLTMEGELGMNPKGDWPTIEANWRFVLNNLLERIAGTAGEKLTQSTVYEAFADLPRPSQPAALALLQDSQWAVGLETLVNADGDRIYLRRALTGLGEKMLLTCSRTYGWLIAERIIANFNRMAVAHQWGIWLRAQGKFDIGPGFSDNLDLLTSQRLYRDALSGLMTCLTTICGSEAVNQSLTAARDTLPWMQREVADSLLLNGLSDPGARDESHRISLIRETNLLPNADENVLRDVARRLYPFTFRAGKMIARQGQIPDQLYILVQGRAQIVHQDATGILNVEANIGAGTVFGCEHLITHTPLPASLQAVTDVQLFALDRASLLPYFEGDPEPHLFGKQINQAILQKIPIFHELSSELLQAVMAALTVQEIGPGQVLIEQGQPAEALYIMQAGQLEVLLDSIHIATLGPGEVCGEQSLLTGHAASATVRATTPGIVLVLEAQDVCQLLQEDGGAMRQLEQIGSRRRLTTREPLIISVPTS